MAIFESEERRAEAEAFMDEHGLRISALGLPYDTRDRCAWDVTVWNKKGQVTFERYAPAPSMTIYDDEYVMSDLVSFTYALCESSDPEDAPYAHRAEVLEAMTGTSIEELASIFETY